MPRSIVATRGEQLGRLKLQFHGQDGTGCERSHYIPRHCLEEFWEAHSISAILRTCSINKSQNAIFQSFLCTFSLLVYINKVDFLGWLVERDLKDATFPLESRPPFWPDAPLYDKLFEAITEWQWIFFPVTLEQHELYNQVFSPQYIFPICTEELIKAGDTIQVHKIETNPSCAGSDPATRVRKTYNESGKAQYEREVKTLTSLQSRSSPHIISYHGCYQQQRQDGTITYNLILGFVEGGNLEEFYTAMNPPRSPPDTNKIWTAFCGVLEGLHHLNLAATGIDADFQTIHQDIKPDNLLVSRPSSSQPYDIRLIITDFGYSHTKALWTSQDTWGIDSHGGQVYGAPESSHHADYTRYGRTHITPKVDIWSLGCVMSEAAIWIKCGRQGLENYRNGRIAETRTLPRFGQAGHGGCFHDGAQALSAVRTTHDWIRNHCPDDTVTLQVLEMIETSMLVPQRDRQDAQMLCERLAKIIQATSSGNGINSPPADGNLKQFWGRRSANPEDPTEVRWFIAQCSGIARGLRKIHHLSTQSSQEAVNAGKAKQMILGAKEWSQHGDIKPENILWFEEYDGKQDHLVISGFGLNPFNNTNSRSKVQQNQILGYSNTYRPPDLHLEGQSISQNYDVWSLGCVFLEFVSWFLLGHDETVSSFVQARLNDGPEENIWEDTFFAFEKGPQVTSKKAMLKKSVVEWIIKLHKTPRCSEPFHALLDLIQFTMLVPNSYDRWKIAWVDMELRQLEAKCNNDTFAIKAMPGGPNPDRFLDSTEFASSTRFSKDLGGPKHIGPSNVGSETDLAYTHPWTDSGYASLGKDTTPTSVGNLTSKEQPNEFDSSRLSDHDEDDTATVYSAAASIPEDDMETYKSELSEAIIKAVRPHVSDAEQLESLKSSFPALLQSFALRLGCPGSSKAEMEIMYFVHKHRNGIANRFDDAIRNTAYEEELTSLAGEENKAPVGWNVGQWLQGVSQSEATGQDMPHPHDSGSKESSGSDPERTDLEPLEEEEEQPSLPDQRGYRDAVFNSVAYIEGEDTCAAFHDKIHTSLGRKRTVSSRSPSKRHAMAFAVEWDPKLFLREQFPDETDMGRLFRQVLTLTGSVTDAQVLPCADYLLQTWPATGPTILKLLEDALVAENEVSRELKDSSLVSCLFGHSQLQVKIEGTADSIATVAEQIIWLGASLRQSCSESGLATCRPLIQISRPTAAGAPTNCRIEFSVEEHATGSQESGAGQCWHQIFQNPVVVGGYPIPRRSQYGSGLEIPLNVMAGLTGCPRINQYMGRHFLKGFSTALVPTEKTKDAVLWHLYYTEDGSRLPYPDMEPMDNANIGLGELTQARHIVGWCSKAQFFAGAAEMNYAIKPSRLGRPGREFALEKITLSVGQIVTGGCQFALGRKDPHVRITRDAYRAKLAWLDQKYVTLWDVDKERGWLLNGNSALLHLLRASLAYSKGDKFNSEFLFQEDKFEESRRPFTLDSARDVLLNPTTQKLKLYSKEDYSYTETKDLPSGETETVTKTVTSWTTVKDRIEELYESLEKLIDLNATFEDSYKGANAKARRHDHLNGWDFTEIATDRDPFHLRTAKLPLDLTSWVELTRAIPAITLFGKGFGDIIRASPPKTSCCQGWEAVPTNKHLLCVSVADLRTIIEQIGDQGTNPITVAPGILWKNPFNDSPFHTTCLCATRCEATKEKSHHCIQELVSTKIHSVTTMAHSVSNKLGFPSPESVVDFHLAEHDNGAVIFGRRAEWKLSRGTSATTASPDPESSQLRTPGHSSTSDGSNATDSSNLLPVVLTKYNPVAVNMPYPFKVTAGVKAARHILISRNRPQRGAREKPLSLRAAATAYGASKSDVQRHLKALEELGRPAFSDRSVGRPRNLNEAEDC
ncbi:hypothetical protein NW759_017083 [Fusarium solani]|nr:hypothetical protein NW759_017083 [Fusarium solani]